MNFFAKCVLGAAIGVFIGFTILHMQKVERENQAHIQAVQPSEGFLLDQIAKDDVIRYQQEGVITK